MRASTRDGGTEGGACGRRHARSAARRAGALLGLAALAGLAVPGTAAAQQERIESPYRWIDRSGRIAPWAGYLFADRGALQLGPGSTEIFGIRVRGRVSSPVSVELNLGLGTADRFVVDPRLETGPAPVDTLPLDFLVAEGAIHFSLVGARSWRRLQPYVVLGAGIVRGLGEETSQTFAAIDLESFRFRLGTAPVVQAGLGAEWDVSDRLGVGFEARDHLLRVKAPDGFFRADVLETIEEAGAPAPKESDWTHNLEVSLALWYYF